MQLRVAVLLAAVAVLGVGAVASPVAAQPAVDYASQVAERDTLVAAQENLLNTYRCMFQVDLGAVKGGCPAAVISPGAAPAEPTEADVLTRDDLVKAQESLLNALRCNHQIDTQLVPGGCPGQTPAPQPDTGAAQTPAISDNTPPLPQGCTIRARSAPTGPLPAGAGATTTSAKQAIPQASLPPLSQAIGIRVLSAPIGPSPAGA